MRLLPLIALAAAIAVATPAFAEEGAGEGGKKAEKADKSEREPGTSVEMPFLIAPMIKDGKLVAYAYISAKIITSTPAAAVGIREKTPFLQDAFVRDVNGAPINKADDPLTVDKPALVARLLADAKRIGGSTKVVSYTITQLQIALAKPK